MKNLHHNLFAAGRGIGNYFTRRPFCVSFEITYSCNAHCKHCHLGGPVPDEKRAEPIRFAERCLELKPVVAQVSGGEPLLRRDVDEVVRLLKTRGRAPVIVLTTNAALLSVERYHALREAGVDAFSVSFDYPDERHDEFRGIPGLFNKITHLLEQLQPVDDKSIALSAVVQRQNFRDVVAMAEYARRWDVKMNFSTYTFLRTHNKSEYMIPHEEIDELKENLDGLREHKRRYSTVLTSDFVLDNMPKFFEQESIPNCRAGERFLVVNPDGRLSPCGLIIKHYDSHAELKADFMKANTCTACFTSIRANTEKPVKYLIRDSLRQTS